MSIPYTEPGKYKQYLQQTEYNDIISNTANLETDWQNLTTDDFIVLHYYKNSERVIERYSVISKSVVQGVNDSGQETSLTETNMFDIDGQLRPVTLTKLHVSNCIPSASMTTGIGYKITKKADVDKLEQDHKTWLKQNPDVKEYDILTKEENIALLQKLHSRKPAGGKSKKSRKSKKKRKSKKSVKRWRVL
jgi:hypothetical protein